MADDAANPITELTMKVDRFCTAMGGQKRIDAIHANGQLTVREHIDQLVDDGTFRELGTLAASLDPAQRAGTPGDGKVVGHALIDARPVAVAGDDITVRRGSSSVVGSRKVGRVFDQALKAGEPFVYLGQTGGARIPDALGAEGLAMVPPPVGLAGRRHQIPVVTAIVGPSFGGSSFISGLSDFVVQVDGTCLAVTSPNVIEVATGEAVSMEELGGTRVHSKRTGQVDQTVETAAQAHEAIRKFLSYLPSNAWSRAPRANPSPRVHNPALSEIVPQDRRKSYDIRDLIGAITDESSFFELGGGFARSLVTGLGTSTATRLESSRINRHRLPGRSAQMRARRRSDCWCCAIHSTSRSCRCRTPLGSWSERRLSTVGCSMPRCVSCKRGSCAAHPN